MRSFEWRGVALALATACSSTPANVLTSLPDAASTGAPDGPPALDAATSPTACEIAGGGSSRPTGPTPVLQSGVWVDISPAGVPFDNLQGGHDHVYTQGMAVDPCNPATLYVAVVGYNDATFAVEPSSGLYKSTDAGSTWSRIGTAQSPNHVRVDPRDSTHLYLTDGASGSSNGFWVSHDAGVTWAMPAGFVTAAQSVVDFDVRMVDVDPSDFGHVLLAFGNPWHGGADFGFGVGNAGVFESFDSGDTWTIHDPDPAWAGAYPYNVFFLYAPELGVGNTTTWLCGTGTSGFWRTTDAGRTWTQVSTTGTAASGGGRPYYTAMGVVYAAGRENLIRSSDDGVTWTSIVPVSSAGYQSVIGDGTSLYTGAWNVPGPMLTSPERDGVTWIPYDSQPLNGGPYEMVFDAANRILYSANTNAGVWALKVD
jgi:hypothetical protein